MNITGEMSRTAIVEFDISALSQRVGDAWAECQKTEHLGLDVGKVFYELREKSKSSAGCKSKSEGFLPTFRDRFNAICGVQS
jgi:hypothetical protein